MQQNKNAKENKIQANLSDVTHGCLVMNFFFKKNFQHNKTFFSKTPRKSNPIFINDQWNLTINLKICPCLKAQGFICELPYCKLGINVILIVTNQVKVNAFVLVYTPS
jgi:hypothetical protein